MSMEEHKRHTFDAYCKKIARNEAVNIQQEYQRQAEWEVVFSDLTAEEYSQLQYSDRYAPDRRTFPILEMDIEILDGDLARALDALTPDRRNIVLMAYLLGMTDGGIAQLLQLARSTVQYQRTSTLEQLRKIMEGFKHE